MGGGGGGGRGGGLGGDWILFRDIFNFDVCCMYSLESPRGNSNENTKLTFHDKIRKISKKYP